jgi:predicted alpha/beta superfamily hydrolase
MRSLKILPRALAWAAAASLALATTAAAQPAGARAGRGTARADTFPAVTLPGTELRHLHSPQTGRDYDLQVYFPTDYARNPHARYPVLYVLDGQWDFKLLMSIQGGLLYDQWDPQIFVVGITWSGASPNYDSLRAMDLTPAATRRLPGSGAAPRFLAFLKERVVPFVEANYRADPRRRYLMGSSFGGLFTLYAMYADPSFFAGYVAASPALTYANDVGFAEEAAYAAAHHDLRTRLFLSVGSIEPLAAPVQRLMGILRNRGYAGLALETRVVAGERHSGNKPEAFNRGLRFVLSTE